MKCFYCGREILTGESYGITNDNKVICINCVEDDEWMGSYKIFSGDQE